MTRLMSDSGLWLLQWVDLAFSLCVGYSTLFYVLFRMHYGYPIDERHRGGSTDSRRSDGGVTANKTLRTGQRRSTGGADSRTSRDSDESELPSDHHQPKNHQHHQYHATNTSGDFDDSSAPSAAASYIQTQLPLGLSAQRSSGEGSSHEGGMDTSSAGGATNNSSMAFNIPNTGSSSANVAESETKKELSNSDHRQMSESESERRRDLMWLRQWTDLDMIVHGWLSLLLFGPLISGLSRRAPAIVAFITVLWLGLILIIHLVKIEHFYRTVKTTQRVIDKGLGIRHQSKELKHTNHKSGEMKKSNSKSSRKTTKLCDMTTMLSNVSHRWRIVFGFVLFALLFCIVILVSYPFQKRTVIGISSLYFMGLFPLISIFVINGYLLRKRDDSLNSELSPIDDSLCTVIRGFSILSDNATTAVESRLLRTHLLICTLLLLFVCLVLSAFPSLAIIKRRSHSFHTHRKVRLSEVTLLFVPFAVLFSAIQLLDCVIWSLRLPSEFRRRVFEPNRLAYQCRFGVMDSSHPISHILSEQQGLNYARVFAHCVRNEPPSSLKILMLATELAQLERLLHELGLLDANKHFAPLRTVFSSVGGAGVSIDTQQDEMDAILELVQSNELMSSLKRQYKKGCVSGIRSSVLSSEEKARSDGDDPRPKGGKQTRADGVLPDHRFAKNGGTNGQNGGRNSPSTTTRLLIDKELSGIDKRPSVLDYSTTSLKEIAPGVERAADLDSSDEDDKDERNKRECLSSKPVPSMLRDQGVYNDDEESVKQDGLTYLTVPKRPIKTQSHHRSHESASSKHFKPKQRQSERMRQTQSLETARLRYREGHGGYVETEGLDEEVDEKQPLTDTEVASLMGSSLVSKPDLEGSATPMRLVFETQSSDPCLTDASRSRDNSAVSDRRLSHSSVGSVGLFAADANVGPSLKLTGDAPSSIHGGEITALAIRSSAPRLIGADKSDAITPHVESNELDGHPGDIPVIAVRPSLRLVTSPISSPHFHPNQIGQSMEVFRLSAAIGAHFEPLLDYSVAIVAFDALFQKYEWDRLSELSEECAKQSLLLHKQLSQIWKDRQSDPLKNLTPQLWVDLILHLGTVFDSTMHALRFVLFRMPHCSDLFSL